MDFGLSEEQELLQETVRGFVANECPPARLRELFDGDADYDPAIWQGMAEMGLAGLTIPEAYGGAGLELIDLALVAEVLGAAALPSPLLGHSLASIALAEGGSDAQKEAWLPRLAAGEALGTIAFGEDAERWDAADFETRAAGASVSGVKNFVTNGGEADLILVGLAGGGLAAVERTASGVKLEAVEGVDRTRRFQRLTLEAAPADTLARPAAARVRDAGLVLLAADALGGAWKLIEMATEYAKTREQFGQPIAHFQTIKHKLADMALAVEPARGLVWFAAHAFDHLPDESERAAAHAKAHLTERFMQVARDAVELHGGIGFTWECDVQFYFKRAMFDRAFLGAPDQHLERAAALATW
jgi:alkylation response protein AidB-like acyl-CoA dehydrogenase